jgi:hypothetical protein
MMMDACRLSFERQYRASHLNFPKLLGGVLIWRIIPVCRPHKNLALKRNFV